MMDIGTSTRPFRGEIVNGDAYFYKEFGSFFLVSVIDGLGHGTEAHIASQAAIEYLEDHHMDDLPALLRNLHDELHGTRGVAIALMRIHIPEKRVDFVGLGNVEMNSTNKAIKPFSVSGIMGHRWREPKVFSYDYDDNDIFFLFSDGISKRFDISEFDGKNTQLIADTILAEHGKFHDDATIVVVRMPMSRGET